jgi:serine/threonine-protein kinase
MDPRDAERSYVDDATTTIRLQSRTLDGNQTAQPSFMLAPGEMVGDAYRILDVIGQGGMGVVYRVEQVYLRQQYALKTLNSRYSANTLMRFQKEAQAASTLRHPNVVSADNFGLLENGLPYLVMDLALGETLGQLLKRGGPLSISQMLDIVMPICSALAYAHGKGVIHRDIKPNNIVITRSDSGQIVPRIVDFGIARLTDSGDADLTRTGEIFGTPFYMSPEQCLGLPVDQRSDIYALGCVIFETLTGAPPFCGEAPLVVMMKHQVEEPPSLKLGSLGSEFPEEFERIVRKALAKNVQDRYQSCLELEEDLSAALTSSPSRFASPKKNRGRSQKNSSVAWFSWPWQTAALLVVAMLFVSLIYLPGPEKHITVSKRVDLPAVNVSSSTLDAIDSTPFNHRYFSALIAHANGEHRVFNFGKKQVGQIGWIIPNVPGIQWHAAVGIYSFPVNTRIFFRVGTENLIENHVDVLRAFRPDDLYELEFRDHAEAWVYTDKIDERVFDEALMFCSQLKSLSRLDLKASPVTIDGLKNMRVDELPNLRYMNLTKTGVDPELLSHLKVIHRLNALTLRNLINVTPVLKAIRNSKNMNSLDLDSTGLKDADLSYVVTMPNLVELKMNGNCDITDKGLAQVAGLKQLGVLAVAGCSISTRAIPTLAKMKHLTMLRLPKDKWKQADIQALQKQLPLCSVTTNDQ